jgi:hypothetical protein
MQTNREAHDTADAAPLPPVDWKDHAEPSQCSKTITNESPDSALPTAKQDLFETHEMLERSGNPPSIVGTD